MKTSEIQIGKAYARRMGKWDSGTRVEVLHRTLAEINELPEEERVALLSLRRYGRGSQTVLVQREVHGETIREFVAPRELVEEWEPFAERAEVERRHVMEARARKTSLKEAWEAEKVGVEEALREHGVEGFIRFHDVYGDLSGRPEVTLTREQVLALVEHLANR